VELESSETLGNKSPAEIMFTYQPKTFHQVTSGGNANRVEENKSFQVRRLGVGEESV